MPSLRAYQSQVRAGRSEPPLSELSSAECGISMKSAERWRICSAETVVALRADADTDTADSGLDHV
jgi:hypothetical protein